MQQDFTYLSYQQLIKPSWAPPSYLFGPVWTFLYVFITISFGYILLKVVTKELPKSIGVPFILNLIFNLLFTPLQFGLRNNLLATIDIVLVLLTLVWIIKITFKIKKIRWVAYLQIPYLIWVTFATILQFTITYLN